MQKGAGILLILIGAAGMGFSKSYELAKRERTLTLILEMVVLLKGEIQYGNSSLTGAFLRIADKLTGCCQRFLREMAGRMQKGEARPLKDIYRECAELYVSGEGLTKKDMDTFLSLGGRLGYLDGAMQIKHLELMEEELTLTLEKLRREMPEKKKLYQSLGISFGALLAVLVW